MLTFQRPYNLSPLSLPYPFTCCHCASGVTTRLLRSTNCGHRRSSALLRRGFETTFNGLKWRIWYLCEYFMSSRPRSHLFCHRRTSHHRKTHSTHATLRGFNEGHLRFTCHLRGAKVSNYAWRDSEVWLYQSAISGRSWAPVKYKRSGATVKILPQIRESRIKFSPASYQRILVGPPLENFGLCGINHPYDSDTIVLKEVQIQVADSTTQRS